jgi:hypothetical protein
MIMSENIRGRWRAEWSGRVALARLLGILAVPDLASVANSATEPATRRP